MLSVKWKKDIRRIKRIPQGFFCFKKSSLGIKKTNKKIEGDLMIQITQEALDYLNKKGKTAVTVEYPEHRTNC